MNFTRRNLLKHSAIMSGSFAALRLSGIPEHEQLQLSVSDIQDSRLKELIRTAVDAATTAGATYADARLSHLASFFATGPSPTMKEHMAFGVRVITDGYWGFAASPVWSTAEAARLGRAAVEQAKANVILEKGSVALAPVTSAESGHWTMPVKDDPFAMAYDEIMDFTSALRWFILRLKFVVSVTSQIEYRRISKAFGSSTGQFTTQQLYHTGGRITLGLRDEMGSSVGDVLHDISPAGLGFEHLRDQPLRERLLVLHDELMQTLQLPVKNVEVGRYDTLCDAKTVADLVSKTLGRPTEIDTALGFEANAGGVGFIDPIDMLGSYRVGSPLLNVSGDRSAGGSVGRVHWDDEGVRPAKVDLIRDGVVVNMQCNREGAALISDHFQRTGQVTQSHGCAYTPTAMDVPMVRNMDLTIRPDARSTTLDSLRSDIQKGVELQAPYIDVDFQCVTGLTYGTMFEIKNGKRVARYTDASLIFRTPELWNNLIGLGGTTSVKRFGVDSWKGQPIQIAPASVFAVPAAFKELTVMRTR